MTIEKRVYPRFVYYLPVTVEVSHITLHGVISNLSRKGLFLVSPGSVNPGEKVAIKLHNPDTEPEISLLGRVVRKEHMRTNFSRAYGLQILEGAQAMNQWHSFVREIVEQGKMGAATPNRRQERERRRNGRIFMPMRWSLQHSDAATVQAISSDLSLQGLHVMTEAQMRVGETVSLETRLPGGEAIDGLAARVVHHSPQLQARFDGFGVEVESFQDCCSQRVWEAMIDEGKLLPL